MAKIYLAASYLRGIEMRNYREMLHILGHEVVSSWLNAHEQIGDMELCSYLRNLCAMRDVTDVFSAEVMFFFSESPTEVTTGGRHVEFGIALAKGIPIFVIGHKENIFHYLGGPIQHFDDFEEAIAELK